MTQLGRRALVALTLVAAVWGALHVGWYGRGQIVDYPIYQHYADAIRHGAVPYRDVRIEYPPAALPVFLVPSWLDGLFNYRHAFEALMALCDVALVLAVWTIAGRRAAILAAVAPLALGSVVLSRFDLWPAALAACALAALLRRRTVLSGVLLGTAFAAKLWPALLVPFVVVWLVRTQSGRAAVRWTVAAVGSAAAWFVPFAILAPGGVRYPFHAQLARPLQLESLGGAILIALHRLADTPLRIVYSFGSVNLSGPGTHAVAIATSVLGAIVLAVIVLLFVRSETSDEELFRYCAAAVAAVAAFGKVFSPQFLLWLVPFVVLVRGRRASVTLPTFGAALVLTQLFFPSHYRDLIHFRGLQTGELLLRDLAVVALTAMLAWPAEKAAGRPRSIRPPHREPGQPAQ